MTEIDYDESYETDDYDVIDNDDSDEDKIYVATPWGLLYSVLTEYGISAGHISGRIGTHIVDDFMEAMMNSGYVQRASAYEDDGK